MLRNKIYLTIYLNLVYCKIIRYAEHFCNTQFPRAKKNAMCRKNPHIFRNLVLTKERENLYILLYYFLFILFPTFRDANLSAMRHSRSMERIQFVRSVKWSWWREARKTTDCQRKGSMDAAFSRWRVAVSISNWKVGQSHEKIHLEKAWNCDDLERQVN